MKQAKFLLSALPITDAEKEELVLGISIMVLSVTINHFKELGLDASELVKQRNIAKKQR